MNKFVLLVVFLVTSSAALADDNWCLTPTPTVDPLKTLNVEHPYPHEMDSALVRIFVHLLRRSDGTGGITSQQADEQLEWLFDGFAPYGVSFIEIGRDEIPISFYDNLTFLLRRNLRLAWDRADAVDIFLTEPVHAGNFGDSFSIPSTALMLSGDRMFNSTIVHEMGHSLGLLHTHEPYYGIELSDGSNCENAGDLVCDTAACPDNNTRGLRDFTDPVTCGLTQSFFDTFPDYIPYPDPGNHMAYSASHCRVHFTDEQVDRMYASIEAFPILQATLVDLTEAKFTDVSDQTGISYVGQPYSAVPGDLQPDMKNDLLVSVTNSFMSLNRGTGVLPSGSPRFNPSSPLADQEDGRGVAVADYDNDGDQDVFVAHATTPKLWRSYNGQYFDITASSGLSTLASGSLAACWGDYDRDGLLDLFVTRGAYVHSEPPSALNITGAQPRLFRNLGNGNFADVTAEANLSGFANACVSPNWGDIDNDGDLDILAMDLGTPPANNDLLFVNQGNGVFMEEHMVRMYYTGIEAFYVTGVVLADMNNDGNLDIVYSSAGAGSSVCLNDGTGYFRGNQRIQFPPQFGEVGTCYSGLQVFDHDLDGWKDVVLLSTAANAPSRSFSCVPTATGVAFLENTAAVGLSSSSRAMGSAAADFTRDGDYDLFMGRAIADGQYFYKTDAQSGANTLDRNYVKVRLASPLKANNWQGIGATITVTAGDLVQTQVVDGGSGRGGQRDRELIFGLADYSGSVTATVKWPRGHVQSDVSVVVSGPAAADSVNTIVDETMVISNLNVVALVVPGTTMYDWVFSWDTNVACDSSQDVLTFDQEGIQNPCWPGWTTLTPSSPGVVYTYEPKVGGGYLHKFTIYGQECNLNCSFRYWAFSAMGANQAASATKTKQIKFCPSDF